MVNTEIQVYERIQRETVDKTSLFGQKVVISTVVQVNLEIAKSKTDSALTRSIVRLCGENNLFVQSKESHKHGRSLTYQLFGSQSLKLRMLEDFNVLAEKFMKLGGRNDSLDVKTTASKIDFKNIRKILI
ncbi:predicted protein [Arabidopsis lyrata subsp. lyrata]|uniref:Predicted protein n=1 Tax=Arabidopsis lyrata subsp. lyrata TaxID=81972 RepID=D7LIE9_ARALL|nr:predicted protein [Arabidopsis lyrata subsp. lyrata]